MRTLDRLACRRAAHDAERHLRILEAGNRFAAAALLANLADAYAAYFSPRCEPTTSRRLRVAIDRLEAFA